MKSALPEFLIERYKELKPAILKRLAEFKRVPESEYFYEFCYCLCTPQSKAKNAFAVQKTLMEKDFLRKPFDPAPLLRAPENYIRFHSQKARRLLDARDYFPEIQAILESSLSPFEKRRKIVGKVNGYSFKESSHFLRNIGYEGLAILDRHILKHLVNCGLFDEIPKTGTEKTYLAVENKFLEFSAKEGVPIDELDILFWSYESGEILK